VFFYSDNGAPACAEVLAAISAANQGPARAYGADEWTLRLDGALSEFFGAPVRAFALATGTAANSLGLATLCPPYGAIFAHEDAHIVTDEAGAPEFFSAGARMVTLPGAHGRLEAATLAAALAANPVSVHTVQPAALSVTQLTELGTAYTPDQLQGLCALAHRHGLRVHMDGARLANAIVHLDCHPADISWKAGVDVLSFGATKNGALAAEALVFFDPTLVRDFELRRKRAGHLISKSRFVSAQLLAYLQDGLWRRNAQHANRLAARIARTAHDRLLHPVEGNEVFLQLDPVECARLRAAGFGFHDWGAPAAGQVRLVVSWNQPEAEVDALCAALAE
jgi:threonine aldolase